VGNQKITELISILGGLDPILVAEDTTLATDFVNVNGQERIAFVFRIGVTDRTVDIKLQLSATGDKTGVGGVGGGTPTDLGTTFAATQVAATGDNRVIVIEARASDIMAKMATVPTKVYLGALITVAAAASEEVGAYVSCVILGLSGTRGSYARLPAEASVVAEVAGS
jgi:hypothetical protein